MEENAFNNRKVVLINIINTKLSERVTKHSEVSDLERILKIVEGYNFQNRQSKKGLLTHTIVDSIQLDYQFLEPFISFDKAI